MEQVIERVCPSCECVIYEDESSWASCFECGLYLDMVTMEVNCNDCGYCLGKIGDDTLTQCQSDECK